MRDATTLAVLTCFLSLPAAATTAADDRQEDPIRVLLIDGDPAKEPGKGETYYLSVALGVAKKGFRVKQRESLDSSREEFRRAEVIILCNVAEVSEEQSRALETFLKQGGSLIIFVGDKIKPKEYNRVLYRDGKGILPGELDGTINLDKAALNLNKCIIPNLARLARMPGGTTAKACALELPESDAVRTICPFSTGQPAIVEKTVGRGKCIVFATTCDRDWTNLPMHPVYVPLVLETVRHAAGKP